MYDGARTNKSLCGRQWHCLNSRCKVEGKKKNIRGKEKVKEGRRAFYDTQDREMLYDS